MLTAKMLESVKKVEATRGERMGMEPRRMTAEEKNALLKEFHPDYSIAGFDQIRVGQNKGEKAPLELVNLLHSNSRILGMPLDLTHADYDVDVLVIGGGGAGASAAIEANEAGANVMMVTKLRIGDANTMMAEGGIQAADKENDSPMQHYLDAFGGGHFAARPELLKRLVMEAPDAIRWLNELGVMFDKDETGRMITTHGGGTSRKRMHACRDYSGAEIMRTLRDEVVNRGIPVAEFTSAVELIKDDKGQAAGAVLLNMETGEYLTARAKTVIIATGGAGRLHYQGFPTSNHYGAHSRRPDTGIPGRRSPAVPGYHSVPSHRSRLSGSDFRSAGNGKSTVPGGHAGKRGGGSVYYIPWRQEMWPRQASSGSAVPETRACRFRKDTGYGWIRP